MVVRVVAEETNAVCQQIRLLTALRTGIIGSQNCRSHLGVPWYAFSRFGPNLTQFLTHTLNSERIV
jgi:hypothetical protein